MLHRSFKSAKCKTALKLAVSRIKLLKNKRAVHMAQLRKEVAQLLGSGQERTARIRVEHVVREEKTMAAYDLLEVYCELIVARLSVIESQKNCPIDLKEAVTSVIFASQRCADLPELQDIRKHLQSKYGKEFSTAAVELRPGCGVSRLMIEKLSVTAPDVQTKTKILSAIASEHNIVWNPETSGENEEKHPEDLLNGPNTFLRASQNYEQPPVQAPTIDTPKHDAYVHEKTSSPPISQNSGSSAMPSTSQSQQGASISGAEGVEHRNTYYGDHRTSAAGKQNWSMEFTDATSAAQAAAEAAERASMAARAAAELSSGERLYRQQQSESQRSTMNDMRNSSIDRHTVPTLSNASVTKVPANKLEHGGESRMEPDILTKNSQQPHPLPDSASKIEGQRTLFRKSKIPPDQSFGNDEKETVSKLDSSLGGDRVSSDSNRSSHNSLRAHGKNKNEQGNQIRGNEQLKRPVHARVSSRSDSLKSKASLREDEEFHNSYSQENIFSSSDQAVEHENIFAGEADFERGSSNDKSTEGENINYFADDILDHHSNSGTSRSHSKNSYDDHNELEHDEFHAQGTETAVFDSSGSDNDVDDKIDFTGGLNNDGFGPFGSPDQRSPINESPKRSSWFASDTSHDDIFSKPIFADNGSSSTKLFGDQADIMGSSRSHESLPVAFDQSDSEDEVDRSDHVVSSIHDSLSVHMGFGTESINCDCVTTAFTKFDEDESQHHISGHSVVSDKERKPTRESLYTRRDETSIEQLSLDTGSELNLRLLSGGLRNKGKKNPPYIKSLSEASSLPSDEIPVNDTSLSQTGTFSSSATQRLGGLQQSKRKGKKSSPSFEMSQYDDDSSHSEDEFQQKNIKPSQEWPGQYVSSVSSHEKTSINSRHAYSDRDNEEETKAQISGSKPHIGSSSLDSPKSSVSSGPAYLDGDNLQNEERITEQISRPKPHLGGLSRRTKTSTSDGKRKASKETYGSASLSVMDTDREEQSEVPKLMRPVPRKSAPEVKRRHNKPSSPNEKSEASSNVSAEPTKGTVSSSNPKAEQAATRQDSIKKASHVHPKLPDFDTLAAHFSSLRKDSK